MLKGSWSNHVCSRRLRSSPLVRRSPVEVRRPHPRARSGTGVDAAAQVDGPREIKKYQDWITPFGEADVKIAEWANSLNSAEKTLPRPVDAEETLKGFEEKEVSSPSVSSARSPMSAIFTSASPNVGARGDLAGLCVDVLLHLLARGVRHRDSCAAGPSGRPAVTARRIAPGDGDGELQQVIVGRGGYCVAFGNRHGLTRNLSTLG
ncbi:hypothetical protein SAMN04488548_12213 [Gordonia westfalica]|uniref:Uncharacterized protein n=1 Tax=Gordonia westfalica TaxID=158898 RepID=A0A1H2DTF4_9ACTN|nr:hypothetical protein SAMN04488548_12213 [Gordonia westfalica]